MEAVLRIVFSYSGGYNYLHRQICSWFRQMIETKPEAYLYYLDDLCRDGLINKYPLFSSSEKISRLALEKELYYLLVSYPEHVPYNVVEVATKQGNLKTLRWAEKNGHEVGDNCFRQAVEAGHYHILEWLTEMDYEGCDDLFWVAAYVGNVQMLEYLEENGYYRGDEESICEIAAEKGHIQVLEWYLDQG
ncbi:Ankyrin repeat-containing protein [Brazilian cedratvirus IHUMI]|uniref:Ankyrin repeat-containing protein n=1 Tax=Brazilian cedratvirus IHUMI TaxID=2126980 RepID=A0A2R8FF86_9VIRU|nr:Ankyrin repeat-containing protein [Brazilian cedratvirus IHUMI]